jgi:hypothetical protein
MSKLAIVMDFDAALPVRLWPAIAVPAAELGRLRPALDDRVVLYAARPAKRAGYVGLARLAGWHEPTGIEGQLVLELADIVRFPLLVRTGTPKPGGPVPGGLVPASAGTLLAGDMEPISEAAFATIVSNGGLFDEAARLGGHMQLAEPQHPFAGASGGEPVAEAFVAALLDSYEGRCPFTGLPLSQPQVVFFHPLELDGQMRPGNAAPACEPAWVALTRGDMTIGARHEFIVALDRLDRQLLVPPTGLTLNAEGRMRMPGEAASRPDPAALRFHRRRVFNQG